MTNQSNSNNPTIAILLAGGGFWGELKSLMPRVCPDIPKIAIVSKSEKSLLSQLDGLRSSYQVTTLVGSREGGINKSPIFWLKLIYSEWKILKQEKPLAVIGLGSNNCLPLAIASRLSGIPFIFIESITRVADLSLTGKLIYKFNLSSKFYVQWPNLKILYPKSFYEGIVHDIRDRRNNTL